MKKFLASLFDTTKRCGGCKQPFLEQVLGVDGALCDDCVAIMAPWNLEPMDPYLLAMWTSGAYPYGYYHDEWLADTHNTIPF